MDYATLLSFVDELDKISEASKRTSSRFNRLANLLDQYGNAVGTGHKRILVPKRVLQEQDVKDLGFVPVTAAIPEAGQTAFRSYRNPDNLYHLHEHGDNWSLHEDRNPSPTMLTEKWKRDRKRIGKAAGSVLTPVKHFFSGLPHTVTEGIPGAYYYLKGKLTGGENMAERLQRSIPKNYFHRVSDWVDAGRLRKTPIQQVAADGK